jgi:hypothetical protein
MSFGLIAANRMTEVLILLSSALFIFPGRAGAKGLAVSFFTDKASKMAGELVTILREANQEIPPQLANMRSFGGGGGRYGGR